MFIIFNYFRKTANYSTLRFILELTLVCFILKLLFVILFGIIFSLIGISTEVSEGLEKELLGYGWIAASILIVLFAAFETITGQWFVIWLTSKFTHSTKIKILASATVFALLHIEPMLIAGVWPIGVVLAWSFILKSRVSRWNAFWVTTSIHVLHNMIVLGLVWLGTR